MQLSVDVRETEKKTDEFFPVSTRSPWGQIGKSADNTSTTDIKFVRL